jgi:hypothetical protein
MIFLLGWSHDTSEARTLLPNRMHHNHFRQQLSILPGHDIYCPLDEMVHQRKVSESTRRSLVNESFQFIMTIFLMLVFILLYTK